MRLCGTMTGEGGSPVSGPLRSRFGRWLPGGADRFPPVSPPVREELSELEVEAKVASRLFLPVRRGGSRAWEASGRTKERTSGGLFGLGSGAAGRGPKAPNGPGAPRRSL